MLRRSVSCPRTRPEPTVHLRRVTWYSCRYPMYLLHVPPRKVIKVSMQCPCTDTSQMIPTCLILQPPLGSALFGSFDASSMLNTPVFHTPMQEGHPVILGPPRANAAGPVSRFSSSVAWLSPNRNRAGAFLNLAVSGRVTHGRSLPRSKRLVQRCRGRLCTQYSSCRRCVTY